MYSAYVSTVSNGLEKTIQDALQFINFKQNIQTDSTVFVKPNFTFPYPRNGVTTTPELLRVLLEQLRNRCARLIVGESDGGNSSFGAEKAFEEHGMYGMCKDLGIDLINLSRTPCQFVESSIQGKTVKVQVPKILINDVDCFVSVPTLKVHVMTMVSLGMKNLWGCYPDTMRGLYHQNLDYKLTLLSKILKPKIIVIDAIYGLNNHGPMFGVPVKLNMILASNNVVVADSLGTRIMGLPLEKVKHIQIAEKEGLGTTNLDAVRINTDWKHYCRKFQLRKTLLDNASLVLFNSDIAARLVIDSPLTPFLYGIAGKLRSSDEKTVSGYLGKNKRCLKP